MQTKELVNKLYNIVQDQIDSIDYLRIEDFNGMLLFKNSPAVISVQLSKEELNLFNSCEVICFLYDQSFDKNIQQFDITINFKLEVVRIFDNTLYLTFYIDRSIVYSKNNKKLVDKEILEWYNFAINTEQILVL